MPEHNDDIKLGFTSSEEKYASSAESEQPFHKTTTAKVGALAIAAVLGFAGRGIKLKHEPSQLLIVQHHREITVDVHHLMKAVCFEAIKRCMILDGAETPRILKVYDKLRPE